MAEEEALYPGVSTKQVGTEVAPKADRKAETNEDTVEVKALKPYLGGEDKRSAHMPDHEDAKPFMVTRRRAAELRANGLADYTNDKEVDREADDAAKEAANKARKKFEVKR